MSLGPLYVFLGEVSVQVFCPFLNWVVCLSGVELCEFFIYFGDQALVWGFIGKYVFFRWLVLLILMKFSFILLRSHLFILSFMSLALGDISVKILLREISEIFLPMFSSRVFVVSWLVFQSFIHLFVYGVSRWSSFIFFACSCPVLPTPFVEEAIFTPFYVHAPFVKY